MPIKRLALEGNFFGDPINLKIWGAPCYDSEEDCPEQFIRVCVGNKLVAGAKKKLTKEEKDSVKKIIEEVNSELMKVVEGL